MPRRTPPLLPCPAVHNGQSCTHFFGSAHHTMRRVNTQLASPILVHELADGTTWTIAGEVNPPPVRVE